MLQVVTLAQLGAEAARIARLIEGMDWSNPVTQAQAQTTATAYCQRVKRIFDIDLVPVVEWQAETNRVVLDATPASDLDRMMFERLKAQEGIA